MANTYAITLLLIILGISGHRVMAAEVGVVQGATLALFYAFSANARSLILNKISGVSAYSVMFWRFVLLVPLAAASYWLSVDVAQAHWLLTIILILRRCIEWLGEVHLSEMERLGNQNAAKRYFLLQAILMLILLVWLVGDFPHPLLGLFLWAFLPIGFSTGFLMHLTKASYTLTGVTFKMLPNLGSTAIIGITVYVFRLLILLATDKETAGDLFTAFAIGGVIGSIFANVLGASIAHHEQSSGAPYFPKFLRYALNASIILGAAIFFAAALKFPLLPRTGKSNFFWETTGLSMIGSVIMVYAQRIRFRLLQNDSEHDVFGPDVLVNILVFASVPFVFYLFGKEAMSGLYLLSSALAYVFYKSAGREKEEYSGKRAYSPLVYRYLQAGIAALLLLPLFFQLGAGIFLEQSVTFDSGGVLRNLPIPVSVLVCYIGILLIGAYRRAFLSFAYIFVTCILMVMSSIILTQGMSLLQQEKFVLLIQYVLPMFALVLGQIYEPLEESKDDATCAKAFFWILIFVVPLQLIFTWQRGLGYLSPWAGLFSIYQSLQYVPVIFVSAFVLALFGLWHLPKYKIALFFLSLCMAIYVAASISMLAIALFFVGLLTFVFFHLKVGAGKFPFGMLLMALVLSVAYSKYIESDVTFKFSLPTNVVAGKVDSNEAGVTREIPLEAEIVSTPSKITDSELPKNLSGRIKYWNYYIHGVSNTPRSFLFGSDTPPDRTQYPSGHNYYLDFIFNFGLFAIIPTLFLIGFTVMQIYRRRRIIITSPTLLSLSLVVMFLIFCDNFLKVGMRQPYAGIFSFFLWGLLITKLKRSGPDNSDNSLSGRMSRG
ncbi:hypothetical protein D9O50_11760 [Oxalobacteraceae bacterium CAVE-383]|nr:hypothetical protein D9O50_11760 [Oxalobacteraceae bacterium CAVE-383]